MLSNLKALAKDTFIYGLSTILSQLLSLFLVPFYTAELRPEEYGLVSLIIMVINFMMPFSGLGLDSGLFRFFAKTDEKKRHIAYFTSASAVKVVFVIFVILILFPFYDQLNSLVFEGRLRYEYFLLFLVIFFLDNVSSLVFVILRIERQVVHISIINIVVLLVSLSVSIYLVLFLKMGVLGILLASFSSSLVKMLLYTRTWFKYFKVTAFSKKDLKELLGYGMPLVPHKIQGMVINIFTLFIINNKLGLAAAGLYIVARKFAKPLQFIVSMVQQAWSPYKFQIHREESEPSRLFGNLISAYWLILISLWTFFNLVVPYLFKLLIDERYWSAIPYVPFIMFLSVIDGVRFTINTGFELSNRQIKASVATFYSMVIIVLVSFLTLEFYPPYGFFIAQGLAYGTTAFLLYKEARKELKISYPFGWMLFILVSSLSLILLSGLFDMAWLNLIIAPCYILLLLLTMRGMYGNGYLMKIHAMVRAKRK